MSKRIGVVILILILVLVIVSRSVASPAPHHHPGNRQVGENCNLLPKMLPNGRFCLVAESP
jgi:hypothetical protein